MVMAKALNKLFYYWRVLATGLSFVVFAIGGLLIGVIIYPLMLLVPSRHKNRVGQYFIHLSFLGFAKMMWIMGIYSITIKNKDIIKNSGLYMVANHPTLIDVVLLLSIIKQSDCVVKSALASSVFTKGPLLVAGYIINDSPQQLIDECVQRLKTGRNLLIFPEGTRTRDLNQLQFKRGASLIAFDAYQDITPITIKCQPRILAKHQKWYKIPRQKPHFIIDVRKQLDISEITGQDEPRSMGSRKINQYLLDYYKQELALENTDSRTKTADH